MWVSHVPLIFHWPVSPGLSVGAGLHTQPSRAPRVGGGRGKEEAKENSEGKKKTLKT